MQNNIDWKILKSLSGLQLKDNIFDELGKDLGLSSSDLVKRISSLKKQGILKRWGIHLNSKALGYEASLVALKLEEEKLEILKKWVSHETGVTHCYSRRFTLLTEKNEDFDIPELINFNIWLTLTSKDSTTFKNKIIHLKQKLQIDPDSILILPSQKKYKLRTEFV